MTCVGGDQHSLAGQKFDVVNEVFYTDSQYCLVLLLCIMGRQNSLGLVQIYWLRSQTTTSF